MVAIIAAVLAAAPSTIVGQQPVEERSRLAEEHDVPAKFEPSSRNKQRTIFDTIIRRDLIRLHSAKTSIDTRYQVRITGKDGEVTIGAGETKLVELPKPTRQFQWRLGEYRPEIIDDTKLFDFVLVQWKEDGHITWINYQSKEAR